MVGAEPVDVLHSFFLYIAPSLSSEMRAFHPQLLACSSQLKHLVPLFPLKCCMLFSSSIEPVLNFRHDECSSTLQYADGAAGGGTASSTRAIPSVPCRSGGVRERR